MGHNKRLIENIGSLTVLQGANYVLPLIILPYLVRVLGQEKFGLVVFAQAFTQYFVVLTDYGFNFTATRQIAIQRDNLQEVSKIFSSIMTIKFALMFVSFALMATIVLSVPRFRSDWQVYFITFLIVLGNVLFPLWLFQGMERMRYITILNLSAKCATVLAVFAFVHTRADYLLAAGIQATGFALAGLMGLWVAWRVFCVRIRWPRHREDLRGQMHDSTQVFIANLAGNVYGQGGILITGLAVGSVAAGFYAIAQKIAAAITGLVQPVAQAIYPYLCNLFVDDIVSFKAMKRSVLGYGAGAGITVGLLVLAFSVPISKFATGALHPQLIVLLRVYSLVLMFTVTNVLLAPFMLAMKKFSSNQRLSIVTALLFLAFSIPATLMAGTVGMAVTMFFIEACIFAGILVITSPAAPDDAIPNQQTTALEVRHESP